MNPITTWDQGGLPVDGGTKYLPNTEEGFQAWADYVAALASRYQGKVKIWMVFNEAASEYQYLYQDSYARLVKVAYGAIKAVDPEALVALAGLTSGKPHLEWVDQVLANLALDPDYPSGCFDVFDYHTYGFMDQYREIDRTSHQDYVALLQSHGFASKPIIIKEGATYSGEDLRVGKRKQPLTLQTEADQAAFLVKRFVARISEGPVLINWSTMLEKTKDPSKEPLEGEPLEDPLEASMSKYTGLVYDGIPVTGEVLPMPDPGLGVKKLSYYAYKFLIEKLRGSDFRNVMAIETGTPYVYCYEVIQQGKPIYIAWWDYFAEPGVNDKQVSLLVADIQTPEAIVTEAVPFFAADFQSPMMQLQADLYPQFFQGSAAPVSDGQVVLLLGKSPVYIE
jgi:hypothetical protein